MKWFLKHPKFIIAVSILITVVFALPLKRITIESSIRQFFPEKHQAYQRLNKTEAEFGSMIAIGVSLETPGETILTKEYIDVIRKITSDLEKVENTSDVTSITNIDYIEGKEGVINVAPILEKDDTEPLTDEDIVLISERLTAWEDMYNLVVISADRKGTQISMSVNPSVGPNEQQAALDKVREIVTSDIKEAGSDLSIKFYGQPVISENSKAYLISDLIHLIPLVILVVLISLYFSFNTKDGTLLPLITVLMSTVWSIGIMALTGMTFSLVSSVIPVALIGCGSAYGIHVLTHYYIAVDKKKAELDAMGQSFTHELHLKCINEGLKNVSTAVVLSAITTIVGFISLVTSPIRPLFGFAIFTALGIAFSLILSVTVIPAFLSLKKMDAIGKRSQRMKRLTERVRRRLEKVEASKVRKAEKEEGEKPGLASTLYEIYHFLCGTKPRMIVFAGVIILFSAIGLSRIVIDTSMVNYFPKNAPMRQDIDYVNDNFVGTNSMYLLIKSPASAIKDQAVGLFDKAQKIEDDLVLSIAGLNPKDKVTDESALKAAKAKTALELFKELKSSGLTENKDVMELFEKALAAAEIQEGQENPFIAQAESLAQSLSGGEDSFDDFGSEDAFASDEGGFDSWSFEEEEGPDSDAIVNIITKAAAVSVPAEKFPLIWEKLAESDKIRQEADAKVVE